MMNFKSLVSSAVAAFALSVGSAPAVAGGQNLERFQFPSVLDGAWLVRIAPFICATGVPVGPQSEFDSLVTFASGGTMTETTSSPRFLPGQRSPGLGYWERSGRHSYEATFQAFIQFTGGNHTQGVQRVEQDIEMADADHWSSTAVVAFTDLTGASVPPSGCMRATAVRMP